MSWDPTNLSLISSAELILSEKSSDDCDGNQYDEFNLMSTPPFSDVWNMSISIWVSLLLSRLEATVWKQRALCPAMWNWRGAAMAVMRTYIVLGLAGSWHRCRNESITKKSNILCSDYRIIHFNLLQKFYRNYILAMVHLIQTLDGVEGGGIIAIAPLSMTLANWNGWSKNFRSTAYVLFLSQV